MIAMIKEWLFLYRQYRKAKKIISDLEKAEFHAILALAYWNDCNEEEDLKFYAKESRKYVRLGNDDGLH